MDKDKIRNSNQDDVLPEHLETQDKMKNTIIQEANVAEAKRIKDFYVNEIKRIETLFLGFTDIAKNSKLDFDQKADTKQCLTKLRKCIKRIRKADKEVQICLETLLEYKIQEEFMQQVSQQNNPGDSDSGDSDSPRMADLHNQLYAPATLGEIVDFPERRSKSKLLHPSNKISTIYQLFVYQLLHSLLLLHDEMSSFSKYQADIIWVLGNQSLKKNQFPTEMIPPKLSREDCLESIERILKLDGIQSIPLASILKQLSSWNIYISSYGKKGTEPIFLYDFYRERPKEDFDGWVIHRYLPEFRKSHPQSIEPEKQRHGEAALDQAALEQHTNSDDFYRNIDVEIEQQDEQKAMQKLEGFLLALKNGVEKPEKIIEELQKNIKSHIQSEIELRKENKELRVAIEKLKKEKIAKAHRADNN